MSSSNDRPAEQARLPPTVGQMVNFDVSYMVKQLDKAELRILLAAEANRSHQVLDSLRWYFDITHGKSSFKSVEYFTDIFRSVPLTPNHDDLSSVKDFMNRWSSAVNRFNSIISYQSPLSSKQNATSALRAIGKHIVRGGLANHGLLRKDDVTRMLRLVLRCMTRAEREDTIATYGSVVALGDFCIDFLHDYNPIWLQHCPRNGLTIPQGLFNQENLQDADFQSDGGNVGSDENDVSGAGGDEEDKNKMRRKALVTVYGQ